MDDWKSKLDAWEAEEPPRGFAERVAQIARTDEKPRSRRSLYARAGAAVLLVSSIAAGAVILLRAPSNADRGEASADDARKEVRIAGGRAIAVLEPGARVSWIGEEVSQSSGDVFYRVEPRVTGEPLFLVHTSEGDVTVKGTCFHVNVLEPDMRSRDIISGAVGAVVSAAVLVGVYEGKVAASARKGGASADVAAGESARIDASGVHKGDGVGAASQSSSAQNTASNAAPSDDDDPLMQANRNLADNVKLYKDKLAANEAEKAKLEQDLKQAQNKLASQENGGAPPKNQFDLSQDDWKQLAEEGTIKARYPCAPPNRPFTASPQKLSNLGLSPDDGPALTAAYNHSVQRQVDAVMPACGQIVGSPELANRLGPSVCGSVVSNSVSSEAQQADMKTVAQIRAGMLPMPGPNDHVDPYENLLLSQTGEMKSFESELAQSLGPDEAHRIAFSDDLGACASVMQNSPGPNPKLPGH